MRTCDPKRSQQILEAAAQLFSRRHYHEVRMEDIADQAKVAKGTLYRYFDDKEDLYLALAVHGLQRLLEESQGKLTAPGEPADVLRAFLVNIVRFYEANPYFLELIQRSEMSGSQTFLSALHTIRQQYVHLLTNVISRLRHSGRQVAHPEWATLALLGTIRGMLRMLPQPWPAELPDWIHRQFLHGLFQGPASAS